MRITDNISANLNAWMASSENLDTIKKVSSRSKVGFGTVQRVKNGDGNPTITNLQDIARAFGKRAEDLLAPTNLNDNVIRYSVKQPPPPAYSTTTQQILDFMDSMNEEGRTQMLGMAKLLAKQFPRKKNHAK